MVETSDLVQQQTVNVPDPEIHLTPVEFKQFSEGTLSLAELIKNKSDRALMLGEPQLAWLEKTNGELVDGIKEVTEAAKANEADHLPASAETITIKSKDRNKAYLIPPFSDLLEAYALTIFRRETEKLVRSVIEASANGPGPTEELESIKKTVDGIRDIPDAVVEAKKDYAMFIDRAGLELKSAVEKVNSRAVRDLKNGHYFGECVIGNGADPVFWALQASRWGDKRFAQDNLVCFDIGRPFLMKKYIRGGDIWTDKIDSEYRDSLSQILTKAGLSARSRFIDTAWLGSVGAALVRLLDPRQQVILEGQENRQISLLRIRNNSSVLGELKEVFTQMLFGGRANRNTEGIEILGHEPPLWKKFLDYTRFSLNQHPEKFGEYIDGLLSASSERTSQIANLMGYIDDSPRTTKTPTKVTLDYGFPQIVHEHTAPATRVRAFAIQQAVIREFLPKAK